MKTTLNKIREHQPCTSGWSKLLRYLGKTQADDEALSISTILDSNGLDDALWCLRAVDGYDREIRLFAVWCARQVKHLMKDTRSLAALDVVERYANGEASDEELAAARGTAWAAAVAAVAAVAAGGAREAAWAAAWAADDAAGGAREAAWAAAVAAGEAAREARGAAWAAWSADDAAWAAAREAQEAEFRRIISL